MLTIDEAMRHFNVKSKEAIYMRVKRNKLEKIMKDGKIYYKIIDTKTKDKLEILEVLEQQKTKMDSLENKIDLILKELKKQKSNPITEPNKEQLVNEIDSDMFISISELNMSISKLKKRPNLKLAIGLKKYNREFIKIEKKETLINIRYFNEYLEIVKEVLKDYEELEKLINIIKLNFERVKFFV